MIFTLKAQYVDPTEDGSIWKTPKEIKCVFEEESLDRILPEIEQFLRGAGFFIYNLDYDTNFPNK